jgi:hypothetical protein
MLLLDWSLTVRYKHVLHVLPVQQRIIFKIAVLAFNYICGTGPANFNDACMPLANILEHNFASV